MTTMPISFCKMAKQWWSIFGVPIVQKHETSSSSSTSTKAYEGEVSSDGFRFNMAIWAGRGAYKRGDYHRPSLVHVLQSAHDSSRR